MYCREPVEEILALSCIHRLFEISHSWDFYITMFKIQTFIKSISILYLKTFAQALDSTSLIKVKPIVMCCLPCSLVQEVVTSFYGEIEIVAVSLLFCLLD